MSDDLCQKYGYDVKWSLHSVRVKMKEFLHSSLDKLISNFREDVREVYESYFSIQRRQLLVESDDLDLKIQLYSYYLEKKTNYVKVKDLLQKLRQFF